MQQTIEKNLQFRKKFGAIIERLRKEKTGLARKTFAYAYDLTAPNLRRIENGDQNISLFMAWKISEALGMKCSELIKILEDDIGEDFTLIDK